MKREEEKTIDYGKLTKRIVFTENDHRHAQLIIKLKLLGITQADFFRHLITGFINEDTRITDYIEEAYSSSKLKRQKTQKLKKIGRQKLRDFGLSVGEVENIFDLIEEEFPEL